MMSSIFMAFNNQELVTKVRTSSKRLFYAGPGIFKMVADAIIEQQKQRNVAVDIVVDPDPEVCRLGYGEINAIETLLQAGISIRKSKGVRIFLLIVDDEGWFFNLPPQCVEREPTLQQANSIRLSNEQIESMSKALGFQYLYPNLPDDSQLNADNSKPTPEIGKEPLTITEVQKAKMNLEERPPEKFDIRRQMNVYHTYIQFVDLHLDGCEFKRHKVQLPKEILNQKWGRELQHRMETSINLLSDNPKISTENKKKSLICYAKSFCGPWDNCTGI